MWLGPQRLAGKKGTGKKPIRGLFGGGHVPISVQAEGLK